MRKDLVIIPNDEPGVLARLSRTLGAAGVNIEGCSAFTGGGKGIVHLLVDDAEAAVAALREDGIEVKAAHDVAVVRLENVPGAIGDAVGGLADAGVNVEQAYFANDGMLVVVSDDVDRARELLGVE